MLIGLIRLRKTRVLAALFISMIVAIAVGCSSEPEPKPTTVAPPVVVAPSVPVEPATTVPDIVAPPTSAPGVEKIYSLAIFEEPSTRNYWNYYGGSGGDVWTGYVLDNFGTTLYDYSYQRYDWIPHLADGFPTPLIKETIKGQEFWTSQVTLKKGTHWSDGQEITADDFVFVVDTVLKMELGSNFLSVVNSDFVDHAEAVDSHTVKVFFNAMDDEGNPQKPGLGVWQFGLAFTPILPKHYWEPIVAQAAQAGTIDEQQQELYSHIPENEPTAGGFVLSKWEPGAFIEHKKAPNWWRDGTQITLYENGAYVENSPNDSYDVEYFGDASGPISLELEIGPHVDSEIFSLYGSQDAAVSALLNGEVDYVFNPQGLSTAQIDLLKSTPGIDVVANQANKVRYLGFNTRKEPFSTPAFRQAIATLIDKEFVTENILQNAAFPVYSMVPEGNKAWHNPDVARIGEGLSRGERIKEAVRLLKQAGFTYDVEPVFSEEDEFVEVAGEGLRMPDGTLVPELTILSPNGGYDPLRSTFAIWIERWLNDAGIPVDVKLTGFGVIVDALFSETVAEDLDMWIFGWSLSLFPDYMEAYFNTRNIEDGVNWGGYSDPRYDQLSNEFLKADTVDSAREKVYELQKLVAEDLPYVVLFAPQLVDIYRSSNVEFPYTESLGGIESWNGLQRTVHIE